MQHTYDTPKSSHQEEINHHNHQPRQTEGRKSQERIVFFFSALPCFCTRLDERRLLRPSFSEIRRHGDLGFRRPPGTGTLYLVPRPLLYNTYTRGSIIQSFSGPFGFSKDGLGELQGCSDWVSGPEIPYSYPFHVVVSSARAINISFGRRT